MKFESCMHRSGQLIRARFGVSVALVAAAALTSACGSSKSSKPSASPAKNGVNPAHVAQAIEGSILAQRHLRSTVACPATVPQQQGSTFDCVATTRSAKRPSKLIRTLFVVTVQPNNRVTYVGK
jgi:hypothetical protein